MIPELQNVQFEQTEERLKIILPTQNKLLWLIVYSVLMLIWAAGLIWGIVFIFRDVAFSGERYAIVFTIMLLIWLYIWYRLGKILWKQWQYYAARREILFIEPERFIIRRPVSLLGITDAYDMEHVSPFYFSEEESCPGFNYGSRRIYFGQELDAPSGEQLVKYLNGVVFADLDEDEY
ncbi:MAG: hypothetical protein ACK2U0_07125 [Candidatus Promineifilaceae bacterium]|jgi:hypothetical protein